MSGQKLAHTAAAAPSESELERVLLERIAYHEREANNARRRLGRLKRKKT